MTKRKKTSREKRALIGAVCTAAVILAGSTFAWFTSSDEVTNRLSASADYNVSAVETFTPPTTWTPGQEVNKDVYALNTGNIPAFVKAKIASQIRVTTEAAGNTAAYESSGTITVPNNAVKLNTKADSSTDSTGITTVTVNDIAGIQAGAVIAYAPAQIYELDNDGTKSYPTKSVIGNTTVAVDANGDSGTNSANSIADFKPNQTGLYVFRHSIGMSKDTDGNVVEEFTYEAYYYVDNGKTDADAISDAGKGTYYKVSIPAAVQTELSNASNGVPKNENGTLVKWTAEELGVLSDNTTPKKTAAESANAAIDTALGNIKFTEETEALATPVLTYEAKGDTSSYVPVDANNKVANARIIATYDAGTPHSTTTGYTTYAEAKASLATAKTTYESAQTTWNSANQTDSNAQATWNAAQAAWKTTQTAWATWADDIVVIINLADDTSFDDNAKWQRDTSNTGTPANTETNFYYTGILAPGTATSQLIDSVVLSQDTQNDAYKTFDFDLNITIDSAQGVYDTDGVKIDPKAANEMFTLNTNYTKYNSIDSTVAWKSAAPSSAES